MNEYNAVMLARLEYERRVRSLPKVYDFEWHENTEREKWLSRQARRLFSAFRSKLTSPRAGVKQDQAAVADTSLVSTAIGQVSQAEQ